MTDLSYELSSDIPNGCGCSACMDGRSVNVLENDTYNDTLSAPTVTATPTQFANYLTNGFWADRSSIAREWDVTSDNIITFSISNSYSDTQKAGIRAAFDMWSDVVDLNFSEVSSGANMSIVTNGSGQAYSSSSVYGNGYIASNTISIDTSPWYWQNFNELGDYAMITIIHEIGHSLGLGHTANYNGSGSYANDAQFVNDSRQYSVMSYFDADNTGANHQGEYASTPLLYDILAMQSIYSANTSTRSGDTVYGFNSTAGKDAFDFTVNIRPVVAIWDGAGTDTLDLSGWSNTQVINLNDGEFSSVGGSTYNLTIAIGATIENAVGGTGTDTIYGNEAANNINANNGDDTIYGSTGSDTIDGGQGTDTIRYDYAQSAFTITAVDSTTVRLAHSSLGFVDTVSNVENFIFSGTTVAFANLSMSEPLPMLQIVAGGNDGGWTKSLFSEYAGAVSFTSGDMDQGGSTVWLTGTRDDEYTLSLSNTADALDFIRANDRTVTALTINGFEEVVSYLSSVDDTTAEITGVQHGKLTTDAGDDIITVTRTEYDTGDNGVFDIYTKAGNDTINVTNNDADLITRVYSGNGNDTITVSGVGALLTYAGAGTDNVTGGAGDDKIYGEDGNDTLRGGAGNDLITGDNGLDNLYGGDGDDIIWGGAQDDYIEGNNGNDNLNGGTGNDEILGGDGDDFLFGDAGNDTLYGGDGKDSLYGGTGNDTLNGGAGKDYLYGEDGLDYLITGGDKDTLYGGSGLDFFIMESLGNGFAYLMDFNRAEFDCINLTDVLSSYSDGVSDVNDFVALNDRGSFTDVLVSANGDGNFVTAMRVMNNQLDGFTVDNLISQGHLLVNYSML